MDNISKTPVEFSAIQYNQLPLYFVELIMFFLFLLLRIQKEVLIELIIFEAMVCFVIAVVDYITVYSASFKFQ